MTRIGVVRHKVSDFSDWKLKFDERKAVRKRLGWAGHELYYDETKQEAYIVHTVKDDKLNWQSSIWNTSKLLEREMK